MTRRFRWNKAHDAKGCWVEYKTFYPEIYNDQTIAIAI